jgi:hypothetical protein
LVSKSVRRETVRLNNKLSEFWLRCMAFLLRNYVHFSSALISIFSTLFLYSLFTLFSTFLSYYQVEQNTDRLINYA